MSNEKKKLSDSQKRAYQKYAVKTKSVSLKFSPKTMNLYDELKGYCEETGKSTNGFILELISSFFENDKIAKHNNLESKQALSKLNDPVPPNFYDKYTQYYCEFVDNEHIEILNGLFGSAVTEILPSEFYDILGCDLDNLIETGGLQFEEWIKDVADRFDSDDQLQKIATEYKNKNSIERYRKTDLQILIEDMYDSINV